MHMVEVDVGVADVWISLSETNIFIIIYSKIVSLRTIKGKEMHLCRTRRWRWRRRWRWMLGRLTLTDGRK